MGSKRLQKRKQTLRRSGREERAFSGLMVIMFAVADGVAEFQEMSAESSKTNPQGKDKQHGQELQDNYKRCSVGTVGIPKEKRKEGAEEMRCAHYLRTSLIND